MAFLVRTECRDISDVLNLACPKRPDSGERRELGEASEKTRGDWGEGCPSIFPPFFRSQFSAPLPYSSHLSPLSERLEYAILNLAIMPATAMKTSQNNRLL